MEGTYYKIQYIVNGEMIIKRLNVYLYTTKLLLIYILVVHYTNIQRKEVNK